MPECKVEDAPACLCRTHGRQVVISEYDAEHHGAPGAHKELIEQEANAIYE